MANGTEIVHKAFKRMGIIDADENPQAKDVSDGLEAMNGMLAQWAKEDCDLGLSLPLLRTDTIDDLLQVEAIINNLAVRLADDYEIQLKPETVDRAYRGKMTLQASLDDMTGATFDEGLLDAGRRKYTQTFD
jgi:hypothetical protein